MGIKSLPMQRSFWSVASIFRGPFLEQVALGTHSPTILELADHYSQFGPPRRNSSLSNWFEFFYKLLLQNYRCEYVYKNTIATRLFLSRHSLQNSFMTDEIRSVNRRADVAILNGTSTVYEIKSQYDSFDRLNDQLEDYKKVFDRICIVTTSLKATTLVRELQPRIGVIAMRENETLSVVREPTSNKDNVDPGAVFDCMRQGEFCSAVVEACGPIPKVPNSQLYRTARAMFCTLPPARAHDLMVSQIKKRGKRKPFVDLIDNAPHSLKHACISFSKSQAMAINITAALRQPLI